MFVVCEYIIMFELDLFLIIEPKLKLEFDLFVKQININKIKKKRKKKKKKDRAWTVHKQLGSFTTLVMFNYD